jgi:hypothetical protein
MYGINPKEKYTLGVMPYQSFGLDRKKQVARLAFFLCSSNNFEPLIFNAFYRFARQP